MTRREMSTLGETLRVGEEDEALPLFTVVPCGVCPLNMLFCPEYAECA
jgi:hypothetical protein